MTLQAAPSAVDQDVTARKTLAMSPGQAGISHALNLMQLLERAFP
jgi:hypothetical protein